MQINPSKIGRRDFGLMALRLSRRWRHAVDTDLQRYGLTAATWRPLFYLGILDEGVRLKDLAEALDMERPSLGQLVDRLEREKLVERRGAADDRRGKTIHLTDTGRLVHDQAVTIGQEVADRLLAGVSEEEIDLCLSVFERVNRAIDAKLAEDA